MEHHLGFVHGRAAHLGLVRPKSLAGVWDLSHLPHDLGEVVAWVVVVGTANVWPALVLAPVGPVPGLAGDAQFGQLNLSRYYHRALILGFG